MTLDDIPPVTIEGFMLDDNVKGYMKRVATCWNDDDEVKAKLELKELPHDDFIAKAIREMPHVVFSFTDRPQIAIRGRLGVGRRLRRLWLTFMTFRKIIFPKYVRIIENLRIDQSKSSFSSCF